MEPILPKCWGKWTPVPFISKKFWEKLTPGSFHPSKIEKVDPGSIYHSKMLGKWNPVLFIPAKCWTPVPFIPAKCWEKWTPVPYIPAKCWERWTPVLFFPAKCWEKWTRVPFIPTIYWNWVPPFQVARTVKFLSGISVCRYVITPEWIEQCEREGQLVNEEGSPFKMRTPKKHFQWIFPQLARARTTELLEVSY